MNDHVIFLREFITRFEETGSAIPSSRWAAQAMTRSLRGSRAPKKILEVGPGTGPVTEKILADMQEGDLFTVCEINPRLLNILKEKLSKNPDFIKNKDRISFFEGPVQDLPEVDKYDIIVCAIPFTNLRVEIVEEIFEKLSRLGHEGTHITFFEYIGLRKISKIASLKERRERLESLDIFFERLYQKFHRKTERVWLNLTPINVYTLTPKLAA